MKKLFSLLLLIGLLGASCQIPSRKFSIIPPTNFKQLCQQSRVFYYSDLFNFCLKYPSDRWDNVQPTAPQSVANSSLTAIHFINVENGEEPEPFLVIYVTGYGSKNEKDFVERGIEVDFNQAPYLIGHRNNNTQSHSKNTISLHAETSEFLDSLKIFKNNSTVVNEQNL